VIIVLLVEVGVYVTEPAVCTLVAFIRVVITRVGRVGHMGARHDTRDASITPGKRHTGWDDSVTARDITHVGIRKIKCSGGGFRDRYGPRRGWPYRGFGCGRGWPYRGFGCGRGWPYRGFGCGRRQWQEFYVIIGIGTVYTLGTATDDTVHGTYDVDQTLLFLRIAVEVT
jgi:hypothetical protein